MSETYANLVIGCPACSAKGMEMGPPAQFYHADDGGRMEVSDEANLRCSICKHSAHIRDWRWGCPKHGDPQNQDYYQPTNSSAIAAQISVAGALTQKMGQKWLMRFLENLDEW